MLIVHPSSTCDICLDGYNWTTPANAPHAIACGHVFCLRCLRLLHPSTCPLCRKAFQPDRIKKLHVDRLATGGDDDDRTQAEESELIQHVALFFGENTPDEDVNAVLGEVHDWLALQGDNPSSHRALRSAVAALHRYKSLQQESRVDKQSIRDLMEEYDRKIRIKDQDIKTSRAIEENLLEEIHTIDDKWRSLSASKLNSPLCVLRNQRRQLNYRLIGSVTYRKREDSECDLSCARGRHITRRHIPSTGSVRHVQVAKPIVSHFPPPDMSRAYSLSNPLPAPPDMSRIQTSLTHFLSLRGPCPQTVSLRWAAHLLLLATLKFAERRPCPVADQHRSNCHRFADPIYCLVRVRRPTRITARSNPAYARARTRSLIDAEGSTPSSY
ncbi:uncharacterized protein B0H18DRAFT_465169 [Fomitopsis serialis]|uniref:uncharacterized protein n=1 Tax=Fomitopsis serialis TaxID=139415 RepID=UPI00200815BF|nr:uncharacterized protein B0H18DRAFT_465169 [Neoantrodia serialis]KAH9923535.1 hypothetical protein B0H18DRAFT_465169 [Neoantrodia serialis]